MMKHACRIATIVLLLASGTSTTVAADDWPQWRGPNRDGKSASTGLLSTWPEGGPQLAWQADGLGGGYSSVTVVGDSVFTLGDVDGGQHVIALTRDGGVRQWRTKIGPVWDHKYLGPRSTPTFSEGRVYALSTEGVLVSLDAATGKLLWQRSLVEDFGGGVMQVEDYGDWRFAESPLIDGDRVIVTPGAADAALVALDKRTGDEIWRAKMPTFGDRGADGAGYSSAVISEGGGVRQIVQLLGRGVIGVEAATGRFLWGYDRVANKIANIATPVVDGDHVFVSTGYGTGSALLRLAAAEGGGVEAREVYFLDPDTLQNHHGGLILHEGTVYTGTGHNKGFPIAVTMADGAVSWGPERNDGRNSAAVTFADGYLYFRYQNGTMVLIEATPEGYRERGSFEIPDVGQFSWAHPVIAGGHLFLREQDRLLCYDIRARSSAAQADAL